MESRGRRWFNPMVGLFAGRWLEVWNLGVNTLRGVVERNFWSVDMIICG